MNQEQSNSQEPNGNSDKENLDTIRKWSANPEHTSPEDNLRLEMNQLAKIIEHKKLILMDSHGMIQNDWQVIEIKREFTVNRGIYHTITLRSDVAGEEKTMTFKELEGAMLHEQ